MHCKAKYRFSIAFPLNFCRYYLCWSISYIKLLLGMCETIQSAQIAVTIRLGLVQNAQIQHEHVYRNLLIFREPNHCSVHRVVYDQFILAKNSTHALKLKG